MRALRGYVRDIAVYMAIPWLLIGSAGAGTCDLIGTETGLLSDGQLFYRPSSSAAWLRMPDTGALLGGRSVTFAYVVNETMDAERSGVVVIKTGRERAVDETPREESVGLLRRPADFDNRACRVVEAFDPSKVRAVSYDRYHNIGKVTVEKDADVLRRFHIEYAARRGVCSATDLRTNDNARSNRSQFSFDTKVVDEGTPWQIAYQFPIISRLAADPAPINDLVSRKVEIRQYRTVRGQPDCIYFERRPHPRAAFLRVNDLEAFEKSPFITSVRAPEHRWRLSLQ